MILRSILKYATFPLALSISLASVWISISWGSPEWVAATIGTVVGLFMIAAAERLNPYREDWLRSHGDLPTDLLHALVNAIVPESTRLFGHAIFIGLGATLIGTLGFSLWPDTLHPVLQLALALVVAEFFAYWIHRATHEIAFFWPWHATHHSPPRLYCLNAARFHPVDLMATHLAHTGTLLVLGCPAEVLALHASFTAVHGFLQHANVDLRLGPLNWVFSMAELHRWHHSLVIEEANNNFGANLILWDIVFGTRFLPDGNEGPTAIGISELPNYPESYLEHLRAPFDWERLQSIAGPEEHEPLPLDTPTSKIHP